MGPTIRRYLIVVGVAILLLFVPVAVSGRLRNTAVRVIHPIGQFLTDRNIGLRNAWLNLQELGTLRDDRTKLQQQVVSLQEEVIGMKDLQDENDTLRKELGVTGVTHDMPKVFANIILQGDNPLDDTFTVDVGKRQGVQVGQPAVVQGSLVGEVIEVRDQTAVIRSITSLQSQVQAWLPTNQEKGFLVGTGNSVYLQDITQGLSVPTGTVVATSGLGGDLPEGILIGSIDTAISAKSELSQTFRVELPVDPASIQSLFILLTTKP